MFSGGFLVEILRISYEFYIYCVLYFKKKGKKRENLLTSDIVKTQFLQSLDNYEYIYGTYYPDLGLILKVSILLIVSYITRPSPSRISYFIIEVYHIEKR